MTNPSTCFSGLALSVHLLHDPPAWRHGVRCHSRLQILTDTLQSPSWKSCAVCDSGKRTYARMHTHKHTDNQPTPQNPRGACKAPSNGVFSFRECLFQRDRINGLPPRECICGCFVLAAATATVGRTVFMPSLSSAPFRDSRIHAFTRLRVYQPPPPRLCHARAQCLFLLLRPAAWRDPRLGLFQSCRKEALSVGIPHRSAR